MTKSASRNFIVLEGPEFSGKSTLHRALIVRLEAEGIAHVALREPGGTEMAEEIRSVLLKHREEKVDPVSDIFLHMAYRRQNIQNIVKPALSDGKWVVSDRFVFSTWCLNVAPYLDTNPNLADLFMGVMPHVIGDGVPEPLCFYLETPEEVRKERMVNSGRDLDRYEVDEVYQTRVNNAYAQIKFSPSTKVIDGTAPIDEQVQFIIETIQAHEALRAKDELEEKTENSGHLPPETVPGEENDGDVPQSPVEEAPVEPVAFDLEVALEQYAETQIIKEVILGREELLPYYKDLAKKIVRKIFEKTNDETIFHPARVGELNREIHSLFHFHERLQDWKDLINKDEPVEPETAVAE
ncbi:putative thymidilate kinase [Pseudomonas phage vB_PaeM_PS119XW]|uniref:dTMP kinase n=2 Tax=root TaxID=1 RepID=A0A5C1K7U4_9CAUD|nr:thymidylate kinase [Pseudomonas phage vB_PaeM_PS119XW]QEM41950.1 putative thymidilate kinase [Pseudomonas phage vB_PaeM_PS119XW]